MYIYKINVKLGSLSLAVSMLTVYRQDMIDKHASCLHSLRLKHGNRVGFSRFNFTIYKNFNQSDLESHPREILTTRMRPKMAFLLVNYLFFLIRCLRNTVSGESILISTFFPEMN